MSKKPTIDELIALLVEARDNPAGRAEALRRADGILEEGPELPAGNRDDWEEALAVIHLDVFAYYQPDPAIRSTQPDLLFGDDVLAYEIDAALRTLESLRKTA